MNTFAAFFLMSLMSLNAVSCYPDYTGILLNSQSAHIGFTMPESCKGQTYCLEKGEDYPDDEDVREVMGTNEEQVAGHTSFIYADNEFSEAECKGSRVYGPVYYIVDEQNNTRAVVQSEGLYEQFYELRWCNEEGPKASTKNIFKNMAINFDVKLFCVTSYVTHDFQVFAEGRTLEIELARAKIPVCCKCKYEKNTN